jgi:hypothetical protein
LKKRQGAETQRRKGEQDLWFEVRASNRKRELVKWTVMLNKLTLAAFIFITAWTCLSAVTLLVLLLDGSWQADDGRVNYVVWLNAQVIASGIFVACVLGTILLKRRA